MKQENKQNKVKIIPLGGLEQIGMNMTAFEYEDSIIVVDCGLAFPGDDMLGIDLVIPDVTYLKNNLDKVKGFVITHGHEDHIGALPYVLKDVPAPVYGTKLTIGLIENKLKEHNMMKTVRRKVVRHGQSINLGCFRIEFVKTNHSIADASALAIFTPAGIIVHTGDFKIDYTPVFGEPADLQRFAELGKKGVLALMCDSTNAIRPGFTMSERTVGRTFDSIFAEHKNNRIIVATFASNVDRVQQIISSAYKYGRKVVFVGRSMVRNMAIAADLGYLHLPEDTVIDLKKAKDYPDNKLVYMCTGSQGEPMAALGRIADGNHRDITINEFDTVILASSLIPGNEHGVYKVINKLVQLGARVVNRDNAAVHVSGHCNEGELLYMYNIVKPKNAMPIHGENRHLVANGLIAVKTGIEPENVVLAEDGDVVDLYHGKAAIVGSVPCGYIYVDGDSVGELTDDELEKRRILGSEGFVSCFAVVDTDAKDVISGPKVYLNAVAEDEKSFEKVRHQIIEQLQDAMMGGTKDVHKLQQIMRRTLGSWVARELHRKPMIVPVVADVAADMESMETYSD